MTIAISTMWSAAYDRLDRFVADARAFGFSSVELNYRLDPAAPADILDCDGLAVSSVHAPCPDVPTDAGPARLLSISSRDETIRQLAVESTLNSFATAAHTGAAAVIVHCGGIAMDKETAGRLLRMYVASCRRRY